MSVLKRTIIFLSTCSAALFFLPAEGVIASSADKSYTARRISNPPVIDGQISEQAWKLALWEDSFLQSDPEEFAVPTEKTAFGIIYDDEAIYIAVRCYDSNPDLVEKKLRRRDSFTSSDWIFIDIDSRNDKQTAFGFALSAGGIMGDRYFYNDGYTDESWDAVWEGHTTVDDSGWVAEFKIPYTSLRFPPAEEYTWGFNVGREICRKHEEIKWVVIPREESGYVSQFGAMEGISGIPQPFNLEVLPFLSSQHTNIEDKDKFDSGLGVDLKYSLNSGLIVNATINPDFGQVEADPAVLNLGVFETYYPEKRPFFVEGSAFFQTPFQLFYSRRIGSSPGYYEFGDDEEIVSSPENTTILGAVKVTGKNSNGLSIGFIEAFTDREYAIVENEAGMRREGILEPHTSFMVARVMQDLWEGNSTIGAMATAKNREGGMSAYAGSVDWNLKLWENNYTLLGQALVTDRGDPGEERDSGYGFNVEFEKEGGKHHFFDIDFTLKSPEFYINDMGFNNRGDQIYIANDYWHRTMEPTGIFRQTWAGIGNWAGWNYDGYDIANGIGWWVNLQYMNYFWTNFGSHYNFERYNDLETRDGPVMKQPANYGYWFWGSTNQNKRYYGTINFWGGKNVSRSWWEGAEIGITMRPADNLEARISLCYDRVFDENQWVDNIEDESDSTHYVFGRLKNRSVNLTGRAGYNFTRDMSIQIYAQPYNSTGEYKEYIELAKPESYKFKIYEPEDNYDFNWTSMNFNLVYRWEYAPGSTIFIVWNRGMSQDEETSNFDHMYNYRKMMYAEPEDIFMVKVNKWFDF